MEFGIVTLGNGMGPVIMDTCTHELGLNTLCNDDDADFIKPIVASIAGGSSSYDTLWKSLTHVWQDKIL